MKRAALLVAAALAGAAAYALLAPADEDQRAARSGERSDSPRLIAALPKIGRLTWLCDRNGRSSTTLTLPRPGATVFVAVHSDGRRVLSKTQIDPAPAGPGHVTTRLERVHQQRWHVGWRHAPATLAATVTLAFARSRIGDCYVRRATTDVRTRLH
jgi:hypothetical protein